MDQREWQHRFEAPNWALDQPVVASGRRRRVLTLGVPAALILALTLVPSLRSSAERMPKPVAENAQSPSHYTFMNMEPGATATPIRWDRCQPIHYVVNPAGAPSTGVDTVLSAVAEAQAASGLQFVYDGLSNRTPFTHAGASASDLAEHEPVIIAWDTSSGTPELAGDTVGIGGAAAWNINGYDYYTTGGVTLDSGAFHRLSEGPDGLKEERSIVLHELGHLLGLDHVTDASQIMYPTTEGQLDYGSGDRSGLAILGHGPCA